MIVAEGLTKYFGPTRALDAVSFRVSRGEAAALLGPNGSGKTTIMRILTGFFPPTSGRAWVAGLEVGEKSLAVRRRIGYLPENVSLYPELRVRSFLAFAAEVKGLAPQCRRSGVAEAIATCGLEDVAGRLIGKLSRGYRQRVGLAQALLGAPEVLVLDEPTVGLDPVQTAEMREVIRRLAGERTILLSTHVLPEASRMCERVIIMNRGRVVAEDSAAGLARRIAGKPKTLARVAGRREEVMAALASVPGVERVEEERSAEGETVTVILHGRPGASLEQEVAARVVGRGLALLEIRPLPPTLEELFTEAIARGEGGRA